MRIDHWMLGTAMLAAVAAAGAEKLDKEYGVNVHVMWEYQEVPDEFRMLKEAGIPMVRADYSWSHQERQPGQWNWGRHDAGLEQAKKNGLTDLKGHRLVGGCRASIYNAMPMEGVQALVEFMKKFEKENA